MNCTEIDKILNNLKVDSLSRIRHKNRVIDKIHSKHLTDVDSLLMDIRVSVAKLNNGTLDSFDALKMVDQIIYQKQIKL